MTDALTAQVLRLALDQLQVAQGSNRRRIVADAAQRLGLSEKTIYRRLRDLGWDSGRKRRRDAGQSRVSEDHVTAVAKLVAKGRNKRGQVTMPVREAVEIAAAHGLLPEDVSYAQVCRRLRESGMGPRDMRAPLPAISRVSRGPNAVWLVDVSIAIQWYFRDAATGKKLDLYSDGAARFYEGKLHNLRIVRKVIQRYLVVDHYSGAYYIRYYYAGGENALDMVDFLYRAMARKTHHAAYPFRGVPWRLVGDQGPSLKNQLITNLLSQEGLDVKLELHATGNAKASGAVESRHNHWQRYFEGRLAARPAADLAELNTWAERLCAVANGQRPHSRHGQPPMVLWSQIAADQLREAPDQATFLHLAAGNARTGTLDNRLWLRADGRVWQLRGELLRPRSVVTYRLMPFSDVGIRVWNEHGAEVAATPIAFDEAGFPDVGAHRHVWDDATEAGASASPTPGQALAARVASGETPVVLDALFDDVSESLARQRYLAPEGQPWAPAADSALAREPVIGSLDAREEIARRLGRPLTAAEGVWWRERLGAGVTASTLEALFTEFTADVAVGGLA